MALTALGSFRLMSVRPVRFVVHDDGSLGANDIERLAAALGEVRVVRRKDADEAMAEHLHAHPATARFRTESLFAIKMLDVVRFGGDPRAPIENRIAVYTDSDVLWRRPFAGIDDIGRSDMVLMTDSANWYALRSWQLLRSHKQLSLVSRVNAGVVSCRVGGFDLDRVEWYLDRFGWSAGAALVEQTLWAMLASHGRGRLWDPAHVAFPGVELPPAGEGPVAVHYAGLHRPLWRHHTREMPRPAGDAVRLGSLAAPHATPLSLATSEARRRITRTIGKTIPAARNWIGLSPMLSALEGVAG